MKVASFIHQANSNHVDRRFTLTKWGEDHQKVSMLTVSHTSVTAGAADGRAGARRPLLSTNHTFKAVCQSQHLFSRPLHPSVSS